MGRLPKNGIRKSLPLDILKTRHRHADSKYRSNVQYLYSKLKEMSPNGAAKDSLLNTSLLCIQSLESEIIQKVGSGEMENYKKDFLNFLLHEESLWKIKDADKWWKKVEEAFNSHDFIENEREDFTDCGRARKSSQTSNGISATTTKREIKFPLPASDFSGSSNVIPCFSKLNESLLIPCEEEGSDYLLSYEEKNCFSNEISDEPVQFENNIFYK